MSESKDVVLVQSDQNVTILPDEAFRTNGESSDVELFSSPVASVWKDSKRQANNMLKDELARAEEQKVVSYGTTFFTVSSGGILTLLFGWEAAVFTVPFVGVSAMWLAGLRGRVKNLNKELDVVESERDLAENYDRAAFLDWLHNKYGVDVFESVADSLYSFYHEPFPGRMERFTDVTGKSYLLVVEADSSLSVRVESMKPAPVLAPVKLLPVIDMKPAVSVELAGFSETLVDQIVGLRKDLGVMQGQVLAVEQGHEVSSVAQELDEVIAQTQRLLTLDPEATLSSSEKVVQLLAEQLGAVKKQLMDDIVGKLKVQETYLGSGERNKA